MQKFSRKKQYKARSPEDTVRIIKGILDECGIRISGQERYYDKPDVASCRIWLSEGDLSYGDFGTNGKGMTKAYSYASAYAELMERLENFILFGDYAEDAYCKGLTEYAAAPDEVMLDMAECWQEAGRVLAPLMRISEGQVAELLKLCQAEQNSWPAESDRNEQPGQPVTGSRQTEDYLPEDNNADKQSLESEEHKTACVPYLDVFRGGSILLPHKTLRMVTGSNGMCAGNNYMEAVTQGLSEIYERAAVHEAYLDNPKIRQLHLESFEGNEIFGRLSRLKDLGYGVKILDLSMGKDYPVVGLLLEKDGAKSFRAGADPCPVTALERCLTETYQGDEETVSRFFKKECCPPFAGADEITRYMINDEEIAYHVDGSGKAADCIFNPSDEFNENLKGTDAESEKSDYEYMIGLTKSLGLDLYIRDWSFMGFPAYHCVIPQLSNYDLIYEEGAEIYKWSFEKTKFRNDHFTKPIALILNRMFEKYRQNLPVQKPEKMCGLV